jgi:hypothetical protein
MEAQFDSPDKLGLWEGGPQALKGEKNWVSQKTSPTRTADRKDESGKSSGETVERSVDFYHGAKRDPNYKDRVALQELAAKIKTVEGDFSMIEKKTVEYLEDHGDVLAKILLPDGDSACLCTPPGSVPCTDCGAGC